MSNWWDEQIRAVTLEFPAADVATIDVKSIVDETHRGHANTLNVFSTGYYPGGTAFYQSRIAPHYPGLGGRDLLAEAIDAAHANGQKAVAYLASIWGNRDLYFAHPDWAQRKADGRVTAWDENFNSVAMDPLSPYREYFASIVKEIAENYAVDGFYFDEPSFQSWSASEACRRAFEAEFGVPLPTVERWDDPVFQKFIAWRFDQIAAWRRSLYDVAKSVERCVYFQGAFPLASLSGDKYYLSGSPPLFSWYHERFGAAWHVPMAHGDDVARTADLADIVHMELYRASVREPLWWYGVALRYVQSIAKGKQILVLSMMAQSPFDLYGLSETELRLSVAELLANSASPLFARYYPDRVDVDAWDNVYARFGEAKSLAPYLRNRVSIPYVALLYSGNTEERFENREGAPSHRGELKGFAKALLQEKILFDVITEADLLAGIEQYRALILPNASSLSAEAKAAVRAYAAAGGGVIGSYEAGMYDATGRRAEADDFAALFGVDYTGDKLAFELDIYMRVEESHALPTAIRAGKRIPTVGMQVGVEAGGAKPVATIHGASEVHYGPLSDDLGPPVVLTHEADKGRRVLFTTPIGVRYLEFGVPDFRRLIADALLWTAREKPPVRVSNASDVLAVTAFRQGERTLIHLVNSIRDEIRLPINETIPSVDVAVDLELDSPATAVSAFGDETAVSWEQAGDTLSIRVSQVSYHALLVIE
ncbi:MAG: family 10 glycosylhydrolase [Chloroflexota bacterium]|nr:family 10 glycosylhydrolase [Chloroflexota bacterium]MDE2909645.1 family 10 glycosylhydrolase [Chloroflexota bacterium]